MSTILLPMQRIAGESRGITGTVPMNHGDGSNESLCEETQAKGYSHSETQKETFPSDESKWEGFFNDYDLFFKCAKYYWVTLIDHFLTFGPNLMKADF